MKKYSARTIEFSPMPEIKLGNKTVPYTIRHSKRAHYLKFHIDTKKGLEVVVPFGFEVRGLEDLMRDRQEWILENLEKIESLKSQAPERQFVTGEKITYLGEHYELEVILTRGKKSTVALQGKYIRVRLKGGVPESERRDAVRSVLEDWFWDQAKKYIVERTEAIALENLFDYGNVKIRGQKTRWGSCSSKRNLNFNWRLMMTPPGAIDYIIIHELCHLIELNHSRKYWRIVEQLCPDYRYWEDWFKENTPYCYL